MFAHKLFDPKSDETKAARASNTNPDDQFILGDTGYGKDNVKILHVVRDGAHHSIKELEVCTHLKLYDHKDYVKGDNSDIIATDSQKNTVYLLAKKHGIKTPEQFGLVLSNHFLSKYRHVKEVHIHIEEYPWERLQYDKMSTFTNFAKMKHNHAFVFTPVAKRYCDIVQKRTESGAVVISGIKDLRVLKTTKSSFVNFVQDEFRSLEDAADRLFSTVVDSKWQYLSTEGVDFNDVVTSVKDIILRNFAGDPKIGVPSPSVQNTLYIAGRDALKAVPQIASISIQMPNKHYILFDTSKFQTVVPGANNEVFVPVDKPSGIIYARLDRKDLKSHL